VESDKPLSRASTGCMGKYFYESTLNAYRHESGKFWAKHGGDGWTFFSSQQYERDTRMFPSTTALQLSKAKNGGVRCPADGCRGWKARGPDNKWVTLKPGLIVVKEGPGVAAAEAAKARIQAEKKKKQAETGEAQRQQQAAPSQRIHARSGEPPLRLGALTKMGRKYAIMKFATRPLIEG
jgi:hypothetical protein